MARKQRNSGFRTLPIQVRISPGRKEKNKTAAKKSREKTASTTVWSAVGNKLSMPTVKETVAQRGMAKNGPMVR